MTTHRFVSTLRDGKLVTNYWIGGEICEHGTRPDSTLSLAASALIVAHKLMQYTVRREVVRWIGESPTEDGYTWIAES